VRLWLGHRAYFVADATLEGDDLDDDVATRVRAIRDIALDALRKAERGDPESGQAPRAEASQGSWGGKGRKAAACSWRTAHMPRAPSAASLALPGERPGCGVSHRRRPWAPSSQRKT